MSTCQNEAVSVSNLAEKYICFLQRENSLLADDDPSYSVISFIQTVRIINDQYQYFMISLSVLFMHLFVYALPCYSDIVSLLELH